MSTAFRHEARPFAGRAGFVESCIEAVRAGLEREELPMVLATSDSITQVREAVDGLAPAVSFVPIDEHARNPSRLVTMLHAYAQRSDASRFLGVCEMIVGGRSVAHCDEIALAECILNTASFTDVPLSVVCLYDEAELDDATLAVVRRSHPSVSGLDANPDFDEAFATVLHAGQLAPPPTAAQGHSVRLDGLATMRGMVKSFALEHGVAPDRADDLVLAANEVVTNSLRYGGGLAEVALWAGENTVVFQTRDHGYLRDPMVGRLAPAHDANNGRGLWLAHHLCDLVQLRSAEADGTTVRLFVDG